MYIFITKFFTE
ncbi:hypothetical protein L6V99_09935 [Escherichia coli]|nr:hypothetical protein L6V99_09935 [Escherichia coli]